MWGGRRRSLLKVARRRLRLLVERARSKLSSSSACVVDDEDDVELLAGTGTAVTVSSGAFPGSPVFVVEGLFRSKKEENAERDDEEVER